MKRIKLTQWNGAGPIWIAVAYITCITRQEPLVEGEVGQTYVNVNGSGCYTVSESPADIFDMIAQQ